MTLPSGGVHINTHELLNRFSERGAVLTRRFPLKTGWYYSENSREQRPAFVIVGHGQRLALITVLFSSSLGAAGVFLLVQLPIMIRIASGKVLAEPLVTLEVARSQISAILGI